MRAIGLQLGVGAGECHGQVVGLLSLALAAVVCGRAVALNAFDAALLLLIVRLRALTRR